MRDGRRDNVDGITRAANSAIEEKIRVPCLTAICGGVSRRVENAGEFHLAVAANSE